jgi:hypothetical protein
MANRWANLPMVETLVGRWEVDYHFLNIGGKIEKEVQLLGGGG